MFATLLGALPRPPLPRDAPVASLVEASIRAQEASGLEPVTDGGQAVGWSPVKAWTLTAHLSTRLAKQVILGPYSAGRDDPAAATHAAENAAAVARRERTLAQADSLNGVLRELVAAGCPMIEVHEPAATRIGVDEPERALYREAHRRLVDGVEGTHLSLAITGGNADAAGIETLLAGAFASLAVDLIAGPDNWRLVATTPGDRGIVCGALAAAAGTDDGPEVLVYAVRYAASTGGRGLDRVGLATASSLAALSWDEALAKLERLGDGTRIAGLPAGEGLRELDPRAIDARSAALGRYEPPPSRS
jgi:methionine synthase II (cobalamin-independent)